MKRIRQGWNTLRRSRRSGVSLIVALCAVAVLIRAFAQYRVFLIHAALAGQRQDRQGTLLSAGAVLCTGAGQRTAGIQNNKAGIGYQFCAGRLFLP